MDLDLKAKRIVYQMSQQLEKTPVDHDFHEALLSLPLPDLDKQAGFDGFHKLQDDIKESIKNYMQNGEKSGFLTRLSGQQMKCVNQMLSKGKSKSSEPSKSEFSLTGQQFRAKRIVMVDEEMQIPKVVPVPFGIPPLEVGGLYRNGVDRNSNSDEEEDDDWLASPHGQSSSRIPEVPMEPTPKAKPPNVENPKSVKFMDSSTVPAKKIASRARPIQKYDAQIQTEDLKLEGGEEVRETERSEKITAEIGTNCRILITPRVEEDYAPSEISRKTSPPVSPISTVTSEAISEGEIRHPVGRITVVRTDGSIVPTPRVMEDIDSIDVLIAKSSSPFGVADMDMSISSAQSF